MNGGRFRCMWTRQHAMRVTFRLRRRKTRIFGGTRAAAIAIAGVIRVKAVPSPKSSRGWSFRLRYLLNN
jgi:hypothetical protein